MRLTPSDATAVADGPTSESGETEVATLYTFDCRRADGSPLCLEVHELTSDQGALARARRLLVEHRSCWNVEVFDADRFVGSVIRRRG